MKAYKLILELLKHPLSEVEIFSQYKTTHIKYNSYCKSYTLNSIKDFN